MGSFLNSTTKGGLNYETSQLFLLHAGASCGRPAESTCPLQACPSCNRGLSCCMPARDFRKGANSSSFHPGLSRCIWIHLRQQRNAAACCSPKILQNEKEACMNIRVCFCLGHESPTDTGTRRRVLSERYTKKLVCGLDPANTSTPSSSLAAWFMLKNSHKADR